MTQRTSVRIADLVSVSEIARRLSTTRARVHEWHTRDTDGFARLRLEVTDPGLIVYSWPDVERWAEESGRLVDGRRVRLVGGPRPLDGRRARREERWPDVGQGYDEVPRPPPRPARAPSVEPGPQDTRSDAGR